MSDSFAVGSEGFRVGRVLGRSITLLLQSFPKCLLFGAVIALPELLGSLTMHPARPADGVAGPSHLLWVSAALGAGAFLLIFMVVYAVCQSSMIYGAFQDIRGRPFEIGASVRRGLARAFPVIGASICAAILIMIGFVLVIVPGFIVMTMLYVTIPACVVERLGPIKSLGRSRRLTSGHRWRVLAIYLMPIIAIVLASQVLQRLALPFAGLPGAALVAFVISAIGGAYQAIVCILTYHDLRAVKEGMDIEQLAAVFD